VNGLDADSVNTNRCVAYVVTRQVEAAASLATKPSGCATANRDPADFDVLDARTIATTSRGLFDRAVFNWMSNDTAAAQSDLKKPLPWPRGRVRSRNVTALQSHSTVAQLSVAPKR